MKRAVKITPRARRNAAAGIVILSLIAWPVSAFWLAKDEPQFVLGLSFLAITLTGIDILATADVREHTDEEGDHAEL